MKRVFVIHGWTSAPDRNWQPWLKKELEKRGFGVVAPKMPDTNHPKIETWVNHIAETVKKPDKDCYFIGHSIGCQTILRYLESLPEKIKVGGVVLVAGWTHLKSEAYEDEDDEKIAKPWIEKPIVWNKILNHTDNFIAIFSDNDKFVPIEDAKIFKEKLGAKILVGHNKGHFTTEDGVLKLPIALESVLKISK